MPCLTCCFPHPTIQASSTQPNPTQAKQSTDPYRSSPAAYVLRESTAVVLRKKKTYTPVLKPLDKLLAVVCETWGGLHPEMRELLRDRARYVFWCGPAAASDRDGAEPRDCLSPQIIAIWRMRLSSALLLGRVG